MILRYNVIITFFENIYNYHFILKIIERNEHLIIDWMILSFIYASTKQRYQTQDSILLNRCLLGNYHRRAGVSQLTSRST